LVDLVLIVVNLEIDASETIAALTAESNRRCLTLPSQLVSPARIWTAGYPPVAAQTNLPRELHSLPMALKVAGECLNPLLSDLFLRGTWNPAEQVWHEGQAAR
jgi:hypothetical protein